MHEVIFHFPCSICWHGKAAGLCPRSSCISSPGKKIPACIRPDPQQNSRLPPKKNSAFVARKDPAQTHSAAPGALGEESPVVIYRSPAPALLLALGSGSAGPGGVRGGRSPRSAPRRSALRGDTAPPPGARRQEPALAQRAQSCAGAERGGIFPALPSL